MKALKGMRDYLNSHYEQSIFDDIFDKKCIYEFRMHEDRIVKASIAENLIYDLKLIHEDGKEEVTPKTSVKLLYAKESSDGIRSLIKIDKKVNSLNLTPILQLKDRHHIKNKTLYSLMMEKEVLFFTLLEGEIIRGVIDGFTRYDITIKLKGGLPLVLLRHSIWDVRNKRKRCYLKSLQQKSRDWKKSNLYVSYMHQSL